MNGLNYIGFYKGISKSTFKKTDGTEGTNFDIKIVTMGATLTVRSSNEPQDLEVGKTYSFPVGARSFIYEDKETKAKKDGLSFYLRNEPIEAVK